MKDMELYDLYKHYKEQGVDIDSQGNLGHNIIDEIARRAEGAEHVNSWLFKMECRKKLEGKT